MRLINVRCDRRLADALAVAVKAEAAVEKQWWIDRRAEIAAWETQNPTTAAERSARLRALHAEHARLRDVGTLRGTRTALVVPALHDLLAEKGWIRRWPPAPTATRGRPWGTHDAQFDGRITLHLPDELGELAIRACHWTSAPIIAQLQKWYDHHGDHWRGHLHNPNRAWTGAGPSNADLTTRDQLTTQIWTTPRLLREAITRATHTQ